MTTKIRFALVWAGALLVVLCFDGRLAGETPTAEKPVPPAAGFGARIDSILSAIERLYDAEAADHFLYVNVTVVGRAFSTRVGYNKWLHDEALDIGGMAETWHTGSAGTHGGDASFILQGVSEHMDRFVVEYLRVNESACAGP